MDSHKMLWHLDRIVAQKKGDSFAPIYIDVGFSKGCNIKCHYCYGMTQGNQFKKGKQITFPREPLLQYMREAGEAGVRSMGFIGEGEPLLNPHVYEAIVTGKKSGIDIGLATNGVLFDTQKNGQMALEHLTWIRFNISAASSEAYKYLHASNQFDTFLSNVKFCLAQKEKYRLPITIGFQMVLTPQDADQAIPLAKLGKSLGIDYLEIKQCGDTQQNTLGIYEELPTYDRFDDLLKEAEAESTEDYSVIVKWTNIKSKGNRDYNRCLGTPFLLYSSGDGKLYPCGMFFDYRQDEFCLGDLTKQGFKAILASRRYDQVMKKIRTQIDVHKECYASCRTNAINSFLWLIDNPPQHVNFV
jgi:MoaA/NifB/PqqE/SkfB family radical SAM enzyme